ncbi:type VII secretion system-associated protein [Streptomyces albogriseolus]|uniref:type VII secretion system-associated protein n=1 Tax=Streptomyces TaxID=1883 RepID=UPI001E450634|nr:MULTISPECIES: type VII secretion system-associated protein [Streptomyces]MCP9990726.1 type VII secretion system-associated protein [Streptomyces albogriseolus]MCX4622516.1 type VII secretion system-associated protein [Streptomyces viridodiastaticus]
MAVTVLDSTFLKNFINNQVDAFRTSLENILKDSPTAGPAISFIADSISTTTILSSKPLVLGPMADENSVVGGGSLNKVIQQGAGEVERILEDQTVLFEDLEQALWDTIDELAKAQGKNLENITADEFMDIFEDVDSDLDNPGGNEEEE